MDGEQRMGDPRWSAARPDRNGAPAPGDDHQATQAYPNMFGNGGQEPAPAPGRPGYPTQPGGDQAATRIHSVPGPAQGADATQLFPGQPAVAPGRDTGGGFRDGSGFGAAAGFASGPGGSAPYGPGQYGPGQYGQNPYGRDPYGRDQAGPGQHDHRPYAQDPFTQDPFTQGPYAQDPFGPGYGSDRSRPGQRDPGGSGGPSRRVVLTSLGVAALLATGVGTVFALKRPADPVTTAAATPTMPAVATPAPTAPAPRAAAVTPATTVTVTATPTRAPATGTPPSGYVPEPWSDPGMEFGTVVAVKKRGDGAVITVRRQQFLIGATAQQYYADHPDKEPLEYAIVDAGGKKQFTVADDALVYGGNVLAEVNPDQPVELTVPEFVSKAKSVLSESLPLRVWMYHRTTANSTVIYLAEQYVP